MTLREGNREYFYSKLDEHFPGLKQQYARAYGTRYVIDSPRHNSLMRRFEDLCSQYGIITGTDRIFSYLKELPGTANEQLEIF